MYKERILLNIYGYLKLFDFLYTKYENIKTSSSISMTYQNIILSATFVCLNVS